MLLLMRNCSTKKKTTETNMSSCSIWIPARSSPANEKANAQANC